MIHKPLLRWVKAPGHDDDVLRAALGQATRLFGNAVDYAVTLNGYSYEEAQDLARWAVWPIEFELQTPDTEPRLTSMLFSEQSIAERGLGYWWKWYPARMRLDAPEMNLDGDIVLTGRPVWFDRWARGEQTIWCTVHDTATRDIYCRFADLCDERKLYRGLLAFPPGFDFGRRLEELLRLRPLPRDFDWAVEGDEQGAVVAALAGLPVETIPLSQLAFASSERDFIQCGALTDTDPSIWGYHFSRAAWKRNEHFYRLQEAGVIFKGES